MVTIKQLEANRLNAQKSTGPKTPDGKAKASQNAVTHGLTSRRPVLSIEDKDEFDLHANEVLVWLDPQDPIEKILARRTAMLSWRLQRASVYETLVLENLLTAKADEDTDSADRLGQIITADFQNTQTLTKIQRYETQLERSMLRCVNTLKRIRDSKLMTYSKIKDYIRGSDEQPEPYFQDENADAKFPAHLEKEMSTRRPQKPQQKRGLVRSGDSQVVPVPAFDSTSTFSPNEPISESSPPSVGADLCVCPLIAHQSSESSPSVAEASSFGLSSPPFQGGVSRSDEGVLTSPAAGDSTNLQNEPNFIPLCSSVPSVAKLQNEPISSINNPVDPVNPVKKDLNAPPLRPRWSTVVLNDVGYSEKARSKMTKVEREEAADRVLMDMKDPEQYLHDRNLIELPA